MPDDLFAPQTHYVKMVIDFAESGRTDKERAAKELLEIRGQAFRLFQLCSKKAKEFQKAP